MLRKSTARGVLLHGAVGGWPGSRQGEAGGRRARRAVLGHLGIYEGFPAWEEGGGICFLGTKLWGAVGASEGCLGVEGSPG